MCGLGFLFFFAPDPSGLSPQAPQVKELGPSHLRSVEHIDMIDPGRVERKDSLHTNAIGDLTHGEGRPDSTFLFPYDNPFEGLDPLLLPLHDLHVDLYCVSNSQIGEVSPQLFPFNHFHRIHLILLPTKRHAKRSALSVFCLSVPIGQ